MICPNCACVDIGGPDDEGLYDCKDCGIWFNPHHHAVRRDAWLWQHNLEPITGFDDELYSFRDAFRDKLCRRQAVNGVPLCAVCARGMYGDAAVHEAIVKRGDLPADERIMAEVNCVVIHQACHENTRKVDDACIAYLKSHYGIHLIVEFLRWIGFDALPVRAQRIIREYENG